MKKFLTVKNYIKTIFVMTLRNIKWLWLKLFNKNNLLKVKINNYEMLLNLSNCGIDIKESSIFKQLALDKTREKEATKVMMEFIKPGDIILEAGANIGYYALMEAKILNGNGKIFAIEPEPHNFELLNKNIRLNNFENIVETSQLAFSDTTGNLPFYVSKHSNLHSFIKPKKEFSILSIATKTIDDFISDKKEKINFIRMDVEGYECKIIKSMGSFLKQNGPLKLFIELHPHLVLPEEMLVLLKELQINGFEVHKVISRDSFIRSQLGETTVQNMTINELMQDERVLKGICALETFFIKK